MISYKRLLYIILVVITVSAIFMVYNFNEERDTQIETAQKPREEIQWLDGGQPSKSSENGELCLVITGKENEDPVKSIYGNVLQIVQDLKISYREERALDFQKILPGDVIVFCSDHLSRYADLMKLGEFIDAGGKVILAGGLPEGTADSYMDPFLGVVEKTLRENYNQMEFCGELWPFQPEKADYSGFNASTWVKVRKDARVYLRSEEKKVPLLYTFDHGLGRCGVINGTFLTDPQTRGLFTGCLSVTLDQFLYPVMGIKAVFLDNFPMVTYVNDALCMKMYGCVTEAFVRDVVWPCFQGMGLRTNSVYSSGVLVESPAPTQFPQIHDGLFVTIGKSALQFDGEFLYAGYADENGDYSYNQRFIKKFHETFPNYQIQGLAVMSEHFDSDMLEIPDTEISVVRNRIEEDRAIRYTDSYACFPQMTQGNRLDDGTMCSIASLHAAYGTLSHTFDINTLIAEDEETASWDRDKIQISGFEREVLDNMSHLTPYTLSQTGNGVKAYCDLDYSWYREGNQIFLHSSHAMLGQPFFFHTTGDVADVEGAEYEKLENGYYMLRLQRSDAIITLDSWG